MKARKIVSAIIFAIGVLLILIPLVIFPTCPKLLELTNGNFVPMKCHWMGIAVAVVGGIVALNGIMLFLHRKATATDYSAPFVLAIAEILLANVFIGACKSSTMTCVMRTQPAINVLSIALLVVSIVGAVLMAREKQEK